MKTSPGSRSLRLAWVVLALEALLFLAAILVFSRYWLMLPVRYRIAGLTGLSILGATGVVRVVRLSIRTRNGN